ncbi:Hypothetical protein KVN_LOCUS493 [uncultured virus]|nr:Hypothetical protein KVN_LOCUS493 [uncultured virus]
MPSKKNTIEKQEPKPEPKQEPKIEQVVEQKASSKKLANKPVEKKVSSKADKKSTKSVNLQKKPAKQKKESKPKLASKKNVSKKEAKPVKQSKQPVENDEEINNGKSKVRFFKFKVDDGDARGRFSGTKPKQAANKALTSILKTREKEGENVNGQIKFSIIECTRGSKHKQYNYTGERVELDDPMKVKIGKGEDAKIIEYKYNNKVMKDKPL